MNKTAVVTGGTHKDAAAIGVLALNIKDRAAKLGEELIVFHDGLSRRDRAIISSVFPTKFYRYHFKISWLDRRKNRSIRYFSPMVFCKYECLQLLREYDCVIWTDYDVVILKDLHELKESPAALQLVEADGSLRDMFLEEGKMLQIEGIDLDQKGVTTPLFVLNRTIGDYMEYYRWCNEATLKYSSYIDLPEQCIFSMMLQKYNIKYECLCSEKYVASPRKDYQNASVIHAAGRPKFWEGLRNEEWERYYALWLELGGSEYKVPLKEKIIKWKEKIRK